jgi:hypothetical protein
MRWALETTLTTRAGALAQQGSSAAVRAAGPMKLTAKLAS